MQNSKKNKVSKKVVIPAVLALSVSLSGFVPTAVFAEESVSSQTLWTSPKGLSNQEIIKAYLQSKVLSAKNVVPGAEQFKIISEETDSSTGIYYVRTVEQINGVPVYGSGQTVALDEEQNVIASFGNVSQTLALTANETTISLSIDEAIGIAKEKVEGQIGTVKNYDGIDAELTILPLDGSYHLTYLVKLSTSIPAPGFYHYFIDANTGDVMKEFNAIHEADTAILPARGLDLKGKMQNFNATKNLNSGVSYLHATETVSSNTVELHTFDARRMGETPFILLSGLLGFTGFEVETKTNFFADPAAISAQINSSKVNKYYQNIHKRNSLDGKGMKLISTVHIGEKWNNAAWNGKQMLYGDGDGSYFSSLAGAIDVAGHEMTHGVITNTANLVYENESGAINESIADIFGVLSEINANGSGVVADWDIGEDVYTPYTPGDGGLRSLSDPKTRTLPAVYGLKDNRYPDHYSDRYLGDLDKGGVHINSSINNKAAYLIAEGGEHNGVMVKGITSAKLEKILYHALTKYLVPSSGFGEMRGAMIQSARDLYPDKNGQVSQETNTVMDAYSSVGVN